MKTWIRYACRIAAMGQPIGRIELTLRLLCLLAVIVGGIAVFVTSPSDRARAVFLLGFFGFIALATSHRNDDEPGENDEEPGE